MKIEIEEPEQNESPLPKVYRHGTIPSAIILKDEKDRWFVLGDPSYTTLREFVGVHPRNARDINSEHHHTPLPPGTKITITV